MANQLMSNTSFGDTLTDANIAQFLATKHWTIQNDRGFDQTWVQPGKTGDYVAVLQLPRDPNLVDYQRRLNEAVETISETFRWSMAQTAEQVAAVRADLFFIRLDQHSSDGTIPLKQATALLQGIDQMIRSAAIVANNPHSSGRGRQAAAVTDFLTDDVRMGHTKKGSFIITVAARLDVADSLPAVFSKQDSAEPETEANDAETGPSKPSFTRQVMTTLARSLEATKDFVSNGGSGDIDSTIEKGVRLPFVQALETLSDAEGLSALDLSFEWAPTEPVPEKVPTRIVLHREELDELPVLREKFARDDEEREETLVGPVIELKRAEDVVPGIETGEVVIRADIDGRSVRVTVPLSGTDYDWAIRAHRAKLPFTVTGELGRKGNSWRLIGGVEVDTEFLEHHFRSNRDPR